MSYNFRVNNSTSTYNYVQKKEPHLAEIINENTTKNQFLTDWEKSDQSEQTVQEIFKKAIDCGNCAIIESMSEIAGKEILSSRFGLSNSTFLEYATWQNSNVRVKNSSRERSIEKLLQLGAPVTDNLLEFALKHRSPNVVALIWEKGGTIREDAYDYTKIPPECIERMRPTYNDYKMKLEKAKPILNSRKQALKDRVFLLKKGQSDSDNLLHQLPNDIFIHLLRIIEERKTVTIALIGEKIECPKKHVYLNAPPKGLLLQRNSDCPVCHIKIDADHNITDFPSRW